MLAWEHERFGIRRLPAFTLSHLPSHRLAQRSSIMDVRSVSPSSRHGAGEPPAGWVHYCKSLNHRKKRVSIVATGHIHSCRQCFDRPISSPPPLTHFAPSHHVKSLGTPRSEHSFTLFMTVFMPFVRCGASLWGLGFDPPPSVTEAVTPSPLHSSWSHTAPVAIHLLSLPVSKPFISSVLQFHTWPVSWCDMCTVFCSPAFQPTCVENRGCVIGFSSLPRVAQGFWFLSWCFCSFCL